MIFSEFDSLQRRHSLRVIFTILCHGQGIKARSVGLLVETSAFSYHLIHLLAETNCDLKFGLRLWDS